MLNSVDFSGRPFHFIGIGGIGMSALAYVLARRRLPVSGSDLQLSQITQRLENQGAHIFWTQDAENLAFFAQAPGLDASDSSLAMGSPTCPSQPAGHPLSDSIPDNTAERLPQIVCSTAINPNNPEYGAAVALGCPIFHRSDILAALMNQYKGIAVAGTHGKTTTTSMVGYLLLKAGLDPTIVVGGEVAEWGGNAHVGHSDYMIAEADESDGSLAKLSAYIGVVTNIELDHPDHYSSLDEVVAIFQTFARQCQITIGNLDCQTVRAEFQPTVSYSLNPHSGADYIADDLHQSSQGTIARIWERGTLLGQLKIKLLGTHNLSNALAAVAIGRLLGLEFEQIADILATFEGARRRFDRRGMHNDILFVDDYAHHPSEIRVTLAAARLQSTELLHSAARRRVVAVFQPHRYSRTAALLEEFATAFADSDRVIVTDVYTAGESNAYGISGQTVADAIAQHHDAVEYCATLESVRQTLSSTLTAGDVVIFLTAGNLNRIIPEVMMVYQKAESQKAKPRQQAEVLSNV
jgi:UDP-N-acetylmuramate--alanine ligase